MNDNYPDKDTLLKIIRQKIGNQFHHFPPLSLSNQIKVEYG